MRNSLSKREAQKLVLLSQRLPPRKKTVGSLAATLTAIENLGYVQIDTITAVERAHHHTLWNRNPGYQATHLNQLLEDKKIFEYWSHAASYLPMKDYRYSLYRKRAIKTGKQEHWFQRDERLMKAVRERIEAEGPLMAKDFDNEGRSKGVWKTKAAKRALENLFMQGDLMIPYRKNFQKVYELTERVLPRDTNTTTPSSEDYARYLINTFLHANGMAQPEEIAYLLKNQLSPVKQCLQDMLSSSELVTVAFSGKSYYALPAALDLLNRPLSRQQLKILSPFDNLLIQRKRMRTLFDFDYLIECYLPAAKRQYGYFSLPILWNGELVARMDCKADRKNKVLNILHLALEPSVTHIEKFSQALAKELILFLEFNGCSRLKLHRVTPSQSKKILQEIVMRLVQPS